MTFKQVLSMGENTNNKHFLRMIINAGYEPIIISSNIEDGSSSYLISMGIQ